MTRRYNHPKRQVDKRALERAQIDERLNSAVSPIIDVAFVQLHHEFAQWPDGWVVDQHGEGGNPHVWFETKRRAAPSLQWLRLALLEQSVTVIDVYRPDRQCTCGLYQSDYVDYGTIVSMLNGIISRDVQ